LHIIFVSLANGTVFVKELQCMKTFSQTTMDFTTDTNIGQQIVPTREDQPVNIGIRIKKLKQPQTIQEPEPIAVDKNIKVKSTRGRKSIKQVAEEADLINIPEDDVLFLKQYYTMGEVAEMFRVNQSLLRFWEAEFSIIQPKKNKKGDRYFRPIDIKNLHLIYHLLRQRKYTIEGAKDFLKNGKKAEEKFESIKKLEQIKSFLLELKAQL
jgi:DNA-binding transcriptional MerR regulator